MRAASMASSFPEPPSLQPKLSGVFSDRGSQRLHRLAEQLRVYRPPPSYYSNFTSSSSDDNEAVVDDRVKVFSLMELMESSASVSAVSPPPEQFGPKRAAVLVCLFEDHLGDLRVLLTKRSSNLSTHSGEVSLPGGKADEGDADDRETALREAKEEISLEPSLVTIVSVLEPFFSKKCLLVFPVIGILPDRKLFKPVANNDEVEEIFDAPLEMFLKDENLRSEEREYMGFNYLVHYFDFISENKKFLIWGLTASILIRAASVVYQRPPSFCEQFPNFRKSNSVDRNSDPTHFHLINEFGRTEIIGKVQHS